MTETVPPLRQAMIASRSGDRPVGLQHDRLLGAVVHVLEAVPVRLQPDRVDAGVGAAAAGHLLERLGHAVDLLRS